MFTSDTPDKNSYFRGFRNLYSSDYFFVKSAESLEEKHLYWNPLVHISE